MSPWQFLGSCQQCLLDLTRSNLMWGANTLSPLSVRYAKKSPCSVRCSEESLTRRLTRTGRWVTSVVIVIIATAAAKLNYKYWMRVMCDYAVFHRPRSEELWSNSQLAAYLSLKPHHDGKAEVEPSRATRAMWSDGVFLSVFVAEAPQHSHDPVRIRDAGDGHIVPPMGNGDHSDAWLCCSRSIASSEECRLRVEQGPTGPVAAP